MPPTILTGFNRAAAAERDAVRRQEAIRDRQELSILEALTKSDDPEIASLAVAGLLDFAAPRKKKSGLAGFLGETESHPMLPQIRSLLQTPVAKPTPMYGLNVQSGVPTGEIRQTPAPVGAAAQPATTPTKGGPIGMPAPVQGLPLPPPSAPAVTKTMTGPPQMVPRRPFLTQTEQTLELSRAKAQGDVEGEVAGLIAAGYTEQEARELVKQSYFRRTTGGASGMQSIAGEMPDGKGGFVPAFGVFDRVRGVYFAPETGQILPGFRPRTSTGSTSLGADRETGARLLFGKPAAQLLPEQMAIVDKWALDRAGDVSYERGLGSGQARADTALLMPLTQEEAALQEVKVGTTWADLQGIVPVTTKQKDRLDAARALAPQIDVIGNLIMDVFPPQAGLVGGLTAAAVLKQKEATRDPKLARLKAAVSLALGNVARVIAAESGRLTEQDAQRARDALVNLDAALVSGDTQESAIAKMIDLRNANKRITEDIRTPGDILKDRPPTTTPPPAPPRREAATSAPPAPPAGPPAAPAGGASPAAAPAAAAPATPAAPPPPALQGVYKPGDRIQLQDGRLGQVMRVLPDGQLGVCPIDPATGQPRAACAAKYGR